MNTKRLALCSLSLSFALLSSCLDNDGSDETWMFGTFSSLPPGCLAASFVYRYTIEEGGVFRIEGGSIGTTPTYEVVATWEWSREGVIQVYRDDAAADAASADDPDYPIDKGTYWEVVRGDCEEGQSTWHDIYTFDGGDRDWRAQMTPGAFCILSYGGDICGDYFVGLCPDAEIPDFTCG